MTDLRSRGVAPELDQFRSGLRTPRAAAAAGIIFSLLLITSLVLIRLTVPANPQDAGAWLSRGAGTTNLALHLLPYAGIAFLWFIGVLRDRLGQQEDKFFATVFLGSGLYQRPRSLRKPRAVRRAIRQRVTVTWSRP